MSLYIPPSAIRELGELVCATQHNSMYPKKPNSPNAGELHEGGRAAKDVTPTVCHNERKYRPAPPWRTCAV
jgi:hypothetical protein